MRWHLLRGLCAGVLLFGVRQLFRVCYALRYAPTFVFSGMRQGLFARGRFLLFSNRPLVGRTLEYPGKL